MGQSQNATRQEEIKPLKIVLFIGHHKVGSTSLQHYLGAKAPSLLREGILYPAVEELGLARLASPFEVKLPSRLMLNVNEAHNGLAFSILRRNSQKPMPKIHRRLPAPEVMLERIRRQIELYKPKCLVLVSEVFSHFGRADSDAIQYLLSPFQSEDITICAILRRPDEHLASWFAQRLRFGHSPPFPKDAPLTKGIHLNYRQMIEPWLKDLPNARLTLMNYQDVLSKGGTTEHFLSIIGREHQVVDTRLTRKNVSPHSALFRIAHCANQALDPKDATKIFKTLENLGQELTLPPKDQIELFGAKKRKLLLRRFRPANEYLSELTQKDFFPDLEQIGQPKPLAEIDVARRALAQIQSDFMPLFPRSIRPWLSTLSF